MKVIKNTLKFVGLLLLILLPWCIKRRLLVSIFHYELSKSAYIGLAFIYPKHLVMKDGATIKHFNVAINLDEIILEKNALIDRSNWITGFPTGTDSIFFSSETNRKSLLFVGENSVITKHHHFDCTNQIVIGRFVTVAGYSSQFLTHSVDIYSNRQASKSINIGDYCFVSTRCILLGGSALPDCSILGASALLNKDYGNDLPYGLYAGVSAKRVKTIDNNAKYFHRNGRDIL